MHRAANPSDLDAFARGAHHDLFARLRREDPVHWHEEPWGTGFWNVTKYADLEAVSRDPMTFSSEQGIVLPTRERAPAPLGGIIMTDPPRHTQLRRVINKHFTARAVAKLEPFVLRTVTRLIDSVAARGSCDFVADISQELPLVVICELMGM